MNTKFIILSLLITIRIGSFCQSNIDSLKNLLSSEISNLEKAKVLNELCFSYTHIDIDSAVYFGEKSLKIFEATKHSKEEINSLYYNLGTAYLDKKLLKSYSLYQKSYKYATSIGNDSLIAANQLALAAYYSRIPNIDSSSYYNVLAIKYFKEIQDSSGLAYSYYNLMSNYNDVQNDNKSMFYGELGYEIAKIKNFEPLLTYFTINMAFNYSKIEGKELLANDFLKKAKAIAIESNNVQILMNISLTVGAQKMKKKDYLSAVENYNQVLQYSIESNDSMRMSIAYNSLGKAYYNLNELKKAAENLKNDLYINRNIPKGVQSDYLLLTMIYANKDRKQHKYYLNKYDSISNLISDAGSEEILAKFETSEKERQIELLKLKETENELINQRKNFRISVLIFTLFLLTFLIGFLYYRSKNKQKLLNQKIELEKQKVLQTENELALKLEALKNNNNLITELEQKLIENKSTDKLMNSIIGSFKESYVSEKQWDNIIFQFNSLEKDFVQNLEKEYSNLTKNDIKLSILKKLNYSNSGMADILNISVEGIKKAKQRLKKKKLS